MNDDLDRDIPGTRSTIEDSATRFNIYFMFGMSMLGSVVFLMGLYNTDARQLDTIPTPVLLICIGMGGFSLFFPWFSALYFARHFLHTVRALEGRLDRLEKSGKPPKDDILRQDDEIA